jgi:hypothetical protein
MLKRSNSLELIMIIKNLKILNYIEKIWNIDNIIWNIAIKIWNIKNKIYKKVNKLKLFIFSIIKVRKILLISISLILIILRIKEFKVVVAIFPINCTM